MKKVIAAFLLSAMLMSLTACGTNQSPQPEESKIQSETVSADTDEKSEISTGSEIAESIAQPEKSSASSQSSSDKSESSAESSAESKPESKQESSSAQDEQPSQQSSRSESTASKPEQSAHPASTTAQSTEITGISLNKTAVTLYPGQTTKLVVTVTPETAADRSAQLSWDDDSVISVASDGTISAKAIGTAVITASTKNGKKAQCTVTVKERPPEPEPQPSQQQPQPSQEPQPEPQPQPQEPSQDTPWTGYVGAVWFNDAVFVGDSVTLKLSYYAENGSLGDAAFLCAGSLGYNNALWDLNRSGNVHPTLYGRKYTVDEGVKASGKKKVFIMLGMNDVGLYGVDGAAEGMKTLTDRILAKSPDVQIYIQSVTPMLKNMQRSALNNRTIPQFNERLRQICAERGFVYLDVASAVKDSEGNLSPENCSDPGAMGIHFTNTGCSKWVDYLKRHVG